jgi:hypothetical protein
MITMNMLLKKLSVLVLFIFTVCTIYTQERSGKTDNLQFTRIKPTDNGFTVYFNVDGLLDENHAELVLQDLLNDSGIYDGRFFKTADGKDRFHLYIYPEVTAEQVRGIINLHSIDFDFTTVSINGRIPNRDRGVSLSEIGSERSHVDRDGFPKFINTGNPEKDAEEYRIQKQKWIDENPEEYQKLIDELKQ